MNDSKSYREKCRELYALHKAMWSDSDAVGVRKGVRRKAMEMLWADLIQGEGGLESAIEAFSPRDGMEEVCRKGEQ